MNKKYRKAIIAGNWKMNMTASEIAPYITALRSAATVPPRCEAVLCVPFPLLYPLVKTKSVVVGAQNVSDKAAGAYTGEVSAAMLADMRIKYCIVGHSERRAMYGETDEGVCVKVKALQKAGITPIVCVGESLEQREKLLTFDFVSYQVKAALAGLEAAAAKRVVIAYEPIWAIGTGVTATAEQAEEVCGHIRNTLRSMYDGRTSRGMSILYGGSMNAKNAAELLAMPDIDGGLIGGASLKPLDFAKIIEAAGGDEE